jgi:predicted RNase H-like nuclease
VVHHGRVSGWRVLGVDGCKAGWIGIVLAEGTPVAPPRAYCAARIGDLVAEAGQDGPLAAIGIDIPIGLAGAGRREADLLARKAAGPRWPSVFMTPVRAALEQDDYAAAASVSRQLTGDGISRQAFALREKILQVDHWVRETGRHAVEVHPEVSFAELAGAYLRTRKATWAGMTERRRLLAGAGIDVPDDLGPAGELAAVDDVLDAAVVAWTASRVARGLARSLPDPPELLSDGKACAVWI